MRPDGSAVEHLDVAVIGGSDDIRHPIQNARDPPAHEAIVVSGARTISFGQVAPFSAGSQHLKDAIQQSAVIDARHTSWLVGQQRFNHKPIEVSRVISAHADAESQIAVVAQSFRIAVGCCYGSSRLH